MAGNPRSGGRRSEEDQCLEGGDLGFGDFAEYSYGELFAGNPKYAEFPMDEGEIDHADMEKFAERVTQRGVGAIVEERRGAFERKRMRRNVYRWSRITILDNFRAGGQEENTFAGGYQ